MTTTPIPSGIQPDTHTPYIPPCKLVKTVNGIPPDEITGNVVVSGGGGGTLQNAWNESITASNNPTMSQTQDNFDNMFQIEIKTTDETKHGNLIIAYDEASISATDEDSNSVLGVNANGTISIFSSTKNIILTGDLTNAVNDAAAAAAGVQINGLYRNGSIVMIRVS